jgi:hypothetical protein
MLLNLYITVGSYAGIAILFAFVTGTSQFHLICLPECDRRLKHLHGDGIENSLSIELVELELQGDWRAEER